MWDKFNDIDFDKLPNQFVLKCTHDSGGLVICKDKSSFNIEEAKNKINKSLKQNYYYWGREWPYKNVKPRIIAEQYIAKSDILPNDYKFFVFNGEIDSVMVCKDRETGQPWFYFYDTHWNRLYYQYDHLEKKDNIDKPTLGPIFDTEVKSSNIFISSLVANPQRLISSSLTINFV